MIDWDGGEQDSLWCEADQDQRMVSVPTHSKGKHGPLTQVPLQRYWILQIATAQGGLCRDRLLTKESEQSLRVSQASISININCHNCQHL